MQIEKRQPGTLVTLRGRDWIVMPSPSDDLLVVKPLGGSDDEITAIVPSLNIPEDKVKDASFPLPGVNDLDDFYSAQVLFNATRLSFRNVSGPFRCMGKLSFRPRSYQIVPLVMALKQEKVRLLVADDVGIGKTVEALLILRELLERGEIKRFAVICLPHLCEQWQSELLDKLDIEAQIIRGSTMSALERKLTDDRSVFHQFPYQVISVDYIKGGKKKKQFLNDCPELIIVDEAHTCASPAGAKSASQQHRHLLLHEIMRERSPHLIMLTATPHSGKDSEFISLLGLLDQKFEKLNFSRVEDDQKRDLADYFIQRKRENIKHWLKEDTIFPVRDSKEIPFTLSSEYAEFFTEALKFARGISKTGIEEHKARMKYWAALALLRGIMSSPAAGLEMLQKRQAKKQLELSDEDTAQFTNPLLDAGWTDSDAAPSDLMERIDLSAAEINRLKELQQNIQLLYRIEKDHKVREALKYVREWVKGGYYPIIFCKYISTANYVAQVLRQHLPEKVEVRAVTSEKSDEERKEIIAEMSNHKERVLVATDCLSEGINLQEHFKAVMHYDLPWNPNRIEQREGRVDRYGQKSKEVKAYLLWGEDNPIDAVVLKVLIKKVRDIQRSTGVSISLGENNESIMDAVLNAVLLDPKAISMNNKQLSLDFGKVETIADSDATLTSELNEAREKATQLRSIFAQESTSPEEIEENLKEVDELIGNVATVENFVVQAVTHLGGQIRHDGTGYKLNPFNLPEHLKLLLPKSEIVPISFQSPTPEGYKYIGRNHRFVEQLCQFIFSLAFEASGPYRRAARASVVQTDAVSTKTTLVQFRVRNTVREAKGDFENIAEEMFLWGYEGSYENRKPVSYERAKELLQSVGKIYDIPQGQQQDVFNSELVHLKSINQELIRLAENRAEHLVKAHTRFKKLVNGKRFEAVKPVLPPDVIGIYILLPKPKSLS